MIDKDKLIKDLEERQDEAMKKDSYSVLGEFRAYAYILRNINKGKYEAVCNCETQRTIKESYEENEE
uniref:Uncharacterized protein n=1 Tax=viral metagenome TaxID=1070528 RepID=A0A6M3X6F2_9ZZZZ